MKEILSSINNYLTLILGIIVSIIAIVEKVKSPIRKSLKKIINECTNPLEKKIDDNIVKTSEVNNNLLKTKVERLRKEILDFAGDIKMGYKKTEKQWEIFILSNQEYEKLIKQLGIENGYTQSEYNFCMKVYEKLKKDL